MATDRLDLTLRNVSRRARRLQRRRDFWLHATVLLLFVLAILVLDAFWRFPDAVREWLRLAVPVVFVALLVRHVRCCLRARRPPEHYVMLLERSQPELETRLINAVQFRSALSGAASAGISPALMNAEIDRGIEAAPAADLKRAVDPRPARRQLLLFAAIAALTLAGHLLYPVFLNALVPRLVDPRGDHPPFSLTRYDVTPGDAVAVYGNTLTITSRILGPDVDRLDLRLVADGAEAAERLLPMFRGRDGEFSQDLADLAAPVRYCVVSERGRSRYYRIELDTSPRIRQADVERAFPAYARRMIETVRLRFAHAADVLPGSDAISFQPEIAALGGSTLTFDLRSNRPLRGGRIRMAGQSGAVPGELVPVDGEPSRVRGSMVLNEGGRVRIELTDEDGLPGAYALEGDLVLLPDREPEIVLVEPEPGALAVVSARLPVTAEAADDYGVRSLSLHYRVNDGEWSLVEQQNAEPLSPFDFLSREIPLDELGVAPGDALEFYAAAEDNDPEGAKIARTPVQTVTVISEEAYRDLMARMRTIRDLREEYGGLMDELEALARRQEELARETAALEERARSGDREAAAAAPDAARRQQELAEAARELAGRMGERGSRPGPTPHEDEMNRTLADMARQIERVADGEMARSEHLLSQPDVESLSLAGARLNQEEAARKLHALRDGPGREVVQEIEQMEDVMRVFEELAQLPSLTGAQKRLTAEMQQLRDSSAANTPDGQHRMARLAEEEAALANQLRQMAGQMGQAAGQIQERYPQLGARAQQLADAIGQRGTPEKMNQASASLADGDAPTGHQRGLEALADLESLMEQNTPGDLLAALGEDLGMPLAMGGAMEGAMPGQSSGMASAGSFGATLQQLAQNLFQSSESGNAPSQSIYGPESPEGGQSSPYSRQQKEKRHLYAGEREGLAESYLETIQNDEDDHRRYLTGLREKYPLQYERFIADYYKRLAEDYRP